jgi:hypothetical protein
MTGQPPRPGPITHTAKPVARSPTDLPRDLSYGKDAELVHVPAAIRVVRFGLPARAGPRIRLDQAQLGEENGWRPGQLLRDD